MPSRSRSLRDALLPHTLKNAAQLAFYRAKWGGYDLDRVNAVDDLSYLPTLSKDEYRNQFMLDFEDPGDAHFLSHSTGTTGAITWRHRSLSEAAVVEHLFAPPSGGQRASSAVAVLNLVRIAHGMNFPMPVGRSIVTIPATVTGDAEIGHCLATLRSKHRVHGEVLRVSAIRGTGEDTALLTQAVLEAGLRPSELAVRTLFVQQFVDQFLIDWLAFTWQASVVQRFSLSEVLGGASTGGDWDGYRLDPFVIGEVINDEGQALPPGEVGELALTELFPLVQVQPLVRYRTGDIVERMGEADDLTFRWWGRRGSCVRTLAKGTPRWAFGFAHVAHLLGKYSQVAREAPVPGLTGVRWVEVGIPVFEVAQNEDSAVVVAVELNTNPFTYRVAAESIASDLSGTLGPALLAGESLTLRIVPRGVEREVAAKSALAFRLATGEQSGSWESVATEPARWADVGSP